MAKDFVYVFGNMRTNGRQQQGLQFDELENEIMVHSILIAGQFAIFVSHRLQFEKPGPQRLFEQHRFVVLICLYSLQAHFAAESRKELVSNKNTRSAPLHIKGIRNLLDEDLVVETINGARA